MKELLLMLLSTEVVPCSWVILLSLGKVPAVRFQDLQSVALGIHSNASIGKPAT